MELSADFEQKEKFIEGLDPRTKLAWYLFLVYFSLTFNSPFVLCIVLLAGISVSLALTGSLKPYKAMVLIMLLLGFQLLILQLLFCREGVLIYQWGIIKIYSEAVPLIVSGMLKGTLLVFASIQFLSWTSSQDFTLMLITFKIPYRYAMLVGLSCRFIPVMRAEYVSILESQITRGLKMESVWDNIRAILPTFLPLLYRAVRRSSETALAMDLRGYGRSENRTFSSELSLKHKDVILIVSMFMVIILSFISRMLPIFI